MGFENPSPWSGVVFMGVLLLISLITGIIEIYKDYKEDNDEK